MTGNLDHLPRSDLYLVYSISNSPYQLWQADLLDFSVRETGQPGSIVRLCALDADYPDLAVGRSVLGYTFETPSFAELGSTGVQRFVRWVKRKLERQAHGRFHFYCLNKPHAMKAFFDDHPALDGEARLLWLDPDMVFHRPWDPRPMVRPGHVCGQRWWGYDGKWCEGSIGGRFKAPTDESALMFPFCITVADMRRISEIFCRLSHQVYRSTRDWKSEMCALVLAMGTAGLQRRSISALGTCNSHRPKDVADAAHLHSPQ
jgi:hypothetical protein